MGFLHVFRKFSIKTMKGFMALYFLMERLCWYRVHGRTLPQKKTLYTKEKVLCSGCRICFAYANWLILWNQNRFSFVFFGRRLYNMGKMTVRRREDEKEAHSSRIIRTYCCCMAEAKRSGTAICNWSNKQHHLWLLLLPKGRREMLWIWMWRTRSDHPIISGKP